MIRKSPWKDFVVGSAVCAMAYLQPYRPVVVHGPSMSPTYLSNTPLLIDTRFSADRLKRDDVVVFCHGGEQLIKRVAYVGGDLIPEIRRPGAKCEWTGLFYTGFKLHYGCLEVKYRQVPDGTVFVLSDNQSVATDSRKIGPVRLEDVVGVVLSPRQSPVRWPSGTKLGQLRLIKGGGNISET